MDGWKWTAGCVLCLVAAGCRTDPAVINLERECRMLEDQVNALEYDLARAESALEACQSTSPTAPRRSPPPPPSSGTTRGAPSLPSLRGPQMSPQNGGPRSPVDTQSLQLPDVEVPGQSLPSGEFPKSLRSPGPPGPGDAPPATAPGVRRPAAPAAPPDSLPPPFPRKPATSQYPTNNPYSSYPPGSYDPRAYAVRDPYATRPTAARPTRPQPPRLVDPRVVPAQAIALDPRADNSRVDRITLSRALTGGYELDARAGDAGVAALVEPRDAQGRLVPAAGPISVVLLDRGLSGDAARVARWDFTAEQTASLYRKTPYGEGIYLEMPWSGNPPAHSHLHLFVRYRTKDGRSMEAGREIDVPMLGRGRNWLALNAPAGQAEPPRTAGWQPRPHRDEPPPAQVASAEEPIRESVRRDAKPAARKVEAPREATAAKAEAAEYTELVEAPQAATTDSSPAADPAPAVAAKPTRPVWSPNRR